MPMTKPIASALLLAAAIADPWVSLGDGYQLTADSAVDPKGVVYFTDNKNDRIMKIDLDGRITLWKKGTNDSHGIAFGPDGRLYAGQHDNKRIVALAMDGTESVIAEDAQTHHLTVASNRRIYFTQAPAHRIWMVDPAGTKRVVNETLNWPRGVRLSRDEKRLMVTDAKSNWVWEFPVQRDGSLSAGRQFCELDNRGAADVADAGGMDFDSRGFLYVATKHGVQVCDPKGRGTTTLPVPGKGASNVFFAGPGRQWLYMTEWNRAFRRPPESIR